MSREARRVPAGSAVEVIQYPAPAPAAGSTTIRPASIPHAAGPGRVAAIARELLAPTAFADRIAAAERAAFARGHAEGERAAVMSASTRVDAMVARFATAIENVAAARTAMLHDAEHDLVRLAMAIAEHVLRRQVQLDPSLLTAMARSALERLGSATAVTIHVNPADFETIKQQPGATVSAVELVADPDVHPGGCIARTAGGSVDVSLDAQFRELTRALLGEHDERAAED